MGHILTIENNLKIEKLFFLSYYRTRTIPRMISYRALKNIRFIKFYS
jgi:hypothetical protein